MILSFSRLTKWVTGFLISTLTLEFFVRSLMLKVRFLYSGLITDPIRFAGIWNLVVTTLQLLLTLVLAIIFGVNL